MNISADILAVLIYILAVFVIYHSFKFRGAYKTLFLLFGFFVVGGGIENINIVFGGYYYPGSPLTIYLYVCPLWVVLGWYLIAYCGCFIAHNFVGKGRGSLSIIGVGTKLDNGIDKRFIKDTILRSALAAYISMLIGLVMDPVAATNGWWIWKVDNIYVHGVPFGNYIGWCLVVFWTLFFHDIIIGWASVKEKKELYTSVVWVLGSIIALLLAGLILMGSTFAFGINGVRTDNRTALYDLIMRVRWEGLLIAFIFLLTSIGFILLSSFASNKLPEPRPTEKGWYVLPPIILMVYWVVMIIAAALTNSLMVANGILYCTWLFFICIYNIKNPYFENLES